MPSFKNSGVYTIQAQGQAITSGQWATDPYYKYTTVLLQGDGMPNSSQNNTFLDNSPNNFTITRINSATQGTFTPYGPEWSNYFGSTSDYLTTNSGAIDGLTSGSSGDYTIEAWVYLTSAPTGTTYSTCAPVAAKIANTNGLYQFWGITSTGYISITRDGSSYVTATGTTPSLNTWNHLAFVNSGTTITVYLNGTSVATMSCTGTWYTSGTSPLTYIGRNYYASLIGYISNLRMVAGTAVYTSNFIPSTVPLTTSSQNVSAANTKLLACQNSRFVDNSNNAYAISTVGSPSVQRYSPFAPQYQYTPAMISGSGYFNGNSCITAPANSVFVYGTGAFTVEAWINPYTYQAGSYAGGLIYSQTESGQNYFTFGIGASGSIGLTYGTGGGTAISSSTGVVPLNAWSHVALVREGTGTNQLKIYVNGVLVATGTCSFDFTNITYPAAIGAYNHTIAALPFGGYISNCRVIKGTAVYTGAFTPPTLAPLSTSGASSAASYPSTTNVNTSFAASATSLLCNFTNAGIYDATMMNDIYTGGNAQVSTSVVKYGSGSMYFDGSGDILQFLKTSTPQLAMGSADWTVECWVYPLTSSQALLFGGQGDASTAAGSSYGLFVNTATTSDVYYNGANGLGTTTPYATVGQWTHIAWVRNGTSLKIYTNGVQTGSSTLPAGAVVNTGATNYTAAIGASSNGSNYFNGYIDDFRFTKGVARYTGNFIPPKVAFANQ